MRYATPEYLASIPSLNDVPREQLAAVLADMQTVRGYIADNPLVTDEQLTAAAAAVQMPADRLALALKVLIDTQQIVAIN